MNRRSGSEVTSTRKAIKQTKKERKGKKEKKSPPRPGGSEGEDEDEERRMTKERERWSGCQAMIDADNAGGRGGSGSGML